MRSAQPENRIVLLAEAATLDRPTQATNRIRVRDPRFVFLVLSAPDSSFITSCGRYGVVRSSSPAPSSLLMTGQSLNVYSQIRACHLVGIMARE
jgi:hypothetical protein